MANLISPRCLSTKAPRAHLFTRQLNLRSVPSHSRHFADSTPPPFGLRSGPAPPRLPKEEQELFETLQRQSTGAFSTPRESPQINQSPDASPADVADAESAIANRIEHVAQAASDVAKDDFKKIIEAQGKGEELHPNVRRGAVPEFEGDTNPKTGEVGGPKNEPLRWGSSGDWTYNGRTTDF